MDSTSHETSTFNPKHLLIDHNIIDFKFYSDKYLLSKYKKDENEKKLLDFISNKEKFKIKSYYGHLKEVHDFLKSKLETMEKMDLDDECIVENGITTKNLNININKTPNLKHSNHVKGRNSSIKKINKKNLSPQKSYNKTKNKNIIINHDGKVERSKIENIDYADVINLDPDKEIKDKELSKFFSHKNSLISIINEMKHK